MKGLLGLLLTNPRDSAVAVIALLIVLPPNPHRRVQTLLALVCFSAMLTWERVPVIFHNAVPIYYVDSIPELLQDLQDPERAERARWKLDTRCKNPQSRALIRGSLADPAIDLDSAVGAASYRARASFNLGLHHEWPNYLSWQESLAAARSVAQKAIILELICSTGLDEAARFYERQPERPEFQLASYRGWASALDRDLIGQGLRREMAKRLVLELTGLPVSNDPQDPGPAAILIRLIRDNALPFLANDAVLDPENPRLAENLAAMTKASLLLPLSVHEALLRDLQDETTGEPIEARAWNEAIAMLGLRGDEATRDRLLKLQQNAHSRVGAERGLALMNAAQD